MSKTTTLTIRVPLETKERLGALAEATGRSKAYLALEAVDHYLDVEAWQIAEIQQGLREADAGEFASDEEVEATFRELTSH